MTRTTLVAVLAALLALPLAGADCGPSPDRPDGGGVDAGPLPRCSEAASLFGIGLDNQPMPLAPGAELPIVHGFQGFEFVRVGLVSPVPLPEQVDLFGSFVVPDVATLVNSFPAVPATPTAEGSTQTKDIDIILNDVPMAELIGHTATITLATSTGSCTLSGAASVDLVPGGHMSADGGVIAPDDGGGLEPDDGGSPDGGS